MNSVETIGHMNLLGQLFEEITNASKGGFFVIRQTHASEWAAKACRPSGKLVMVKHPERLAACERLLVALR